MAKEKFDRSKPHKNIGKIAVHTTGNEETNLRQMVDRWNTSTQHPHSQNWSKYEELDASPEKV